MKTNNSHIFIQMANDAKFDVPTFNRRDLCQHCCAFDDCCTIEDEPVCGSCFSELYNDDWSLKVLPADVSYGPYSSPIRRAA